ncbi:VOC family protein [Leucobacter chromiireducens]|uniref:VOC family protein n=1 Tax=Leucobacter chromiireducens TaxID=283877 RepID=UPI000F63B9B0|nr:VOC family protein [Leucobacter chromiireducens]
MALTWKIVIDCADPHALADFWAAALDYTVEDPGALVTELRESGRIPASEVTTHLGSERFARFAAIRHPDDPFTEFTGIGAGRRILFQQVPEPKQVKNRLHLDLHDDGGDVEALVTRLEAFGARRIEFVDEGPAGSWWVMADPEGNEFCAAAVG